ncbi:hypothetical protein IWW50_001478 [Coemansia erecta]|nr:hypothetical protein GGF43_000038 [Coemansia sp. RSA 2618]KAJ2828273.1 hypothetical protein IWW50_001478 [Coemansia erecta]
MSLAVILYRHRLTLLALFALGALFMLFTHAPATTGPSNSNFKAPKFDENDIRWVQQNRQRQRYPPPVPNQPEQRKEPAQPPKQPNPASSTQPAPAPAPVLPADLPKQKVEQEAAQEDSHPPAEQSDVEKKVRQLIKRNRVMVFSKTYCPYSRNTKILLSKYHDDRGLEFSVLEADLEADPYEVKEVLGKLSGHFTFPNIFVDGQSIGGNEELRLMHASGELVSMLGDKKLIV